MLQLLVQYAISGHQFIKDQDSDHHVDLLIGDRQECQLFNECAAMRSFQR